ncbi:MAG: hypothetical protein ACK504_00440 [Bacteroidota bacterium]
MKKQFSEISGVLLTSKEMKELKGGFYVTPPKKNVCDGQECPLAGGTSCAPMAVGGCACSKTPHGVDVQNSACTPVRSTKDSTSTTFVTATGSLYATNVSLFSSSFFNR